MPEKVPAITRPEPERVIPRRRREATTLAAVAGGELTTTARAGNCVVEADPEGVLRQHAPKETQLVRKAALGIDLKRVEAAEGALKETLRQAAAAAAVPAQTEEPAHLDEMEIMAEQAMTEADMPETLRPHGIDRRVLKEFFTAGTTGSSASGEAAAQCFYSGGNRPYAGSMAVHQPSRTTPYGRRLR